MSLKVGQLTIRSLAVSLSLLLVVASIGPSVAIACEGAGEESATLTPHEWGEGTTGKKEACPKSGAEVVFGKTGKWCEYGLKNTNVSEDIKLKHEGFNIKSSQCAETECVGLIAGVAAGKSECKNVIALGPGVECRERVEYKNEPTEAQLIGYELALESEPSGAQFSVEKYQKIE